LLWFGAMIAIVGASVAVRGRAAAPDPVPPTSVTWTATPAPTSEPTADATAGPAVATLTPVPTATAGAVQDPARRVPVLEYHYSTFALNDDVQMTTEWFEAQMASLAVGGYHTLTGAEFAAYVRGEHPVPARSVVLRFDVGESHFDDYATVIVPALRRHGLHGVFFVLASRTHDDCDGLRACWPTLMAWVDEGLISLESHSLWHLDYRELPPEQIVADAMQSKALIEAKAGVTVHGLCYPFDSVNPAAFAILRDLGYAYAVAGPTRAERSVLPADPDPYNLPSYYPYASPARYPLLIGAGWTFEEMLIAATQ
jgi:peptidoglycan/xylan/chitin deacetylase (PgdA/CDA1 family)